MRGAGRRTATAGSLVLAALVLVGACGSDDDGSSATTTARAASGLEGSITVAAAASLQQAFTEIGSQLEADHPGVDITFTFDASSTLATQIQSGAPVSVFASADEANMDKVVTAGLVRDPEVFARNRLEIAVKPGNPKDVSGLGDLAGVGVVALCGEAVPCGRYAAEVLAKADVTIPPDRITRGQNASATLAAVSTGDAEAAIVYVTDVAAAGDAVEGVAIPAGQNAIATYPIAVRTGLDPDEQEIAVAFVEAVLGPRGQRILDAAGFLAP